MRHLLVIGPALILSSALCAQTYSTAPPGFVSTANTGLGSYSITFGAYYDERSQIVDGNYKSVPLSIKELALRRDEAPLASTQTIGKTWANFELKVGDCDYAAVTNNWDTNFLSAPTLLISGTLNWPDATQQSPTAPEPWGDLLPTKGGCTTTGGKTTCTALLFPFATPYLYTGSYDLLWEFQFFGGTLNNSQPWGDYNKSYYLDATSNRATVGGGVSTPTPYSAPIMTSCAHTGSTRVGYGYSRIVTYAVHNDPNLPPGSSDSFEVSFAVRDAKSTTGIIAVSLFGSNDIGQGVYIGGTNSLGQANVGCMPLGLDLSKPLVIMMPVTTTTATIYETPRQYIKYNAAWAGLTPIYGQYFFDDPARGGLQLTGTSTSLIFDQPTLQPWKSLIIGDYGTGNRGPQPRSGTGPVPSAINVPILRYTL
jgi:hypothetical protein